MADLNTNNSALQSILTAVNNLLTIDDITPELIGADDRGSAAAALTSAKSYTDSEIADLINGAPTTLDTLGEIATAMSENANVVDALNTAIGNKANTSDLTSHTNNKSNPHAVTKAQVGLGNVENKTSATIRGELTKANVTDALGYTPPTQDTTYSVATQSADGLMSAADKKTLDTLDSYVGDSSVSSQINTAIANKVDKVSGKGLSTNDYTTTEKNKLSGIASGAEVNQNAFSNIAVGSTTIAADTKTDTLTLVAGSNVTLTPDATNDKITIAAQDTVYTHPTYTAKSSGLYKVTVDGTGHVSGTAAVAKADITALGIPAQDTTYSAATTSAAGLMSASDKSKLDGIATGANKITVDSALSSTSTNPVQNKVINTALSGKQATITGAATTITSSNLTASRALVSDTNGKVAVSAVTSTELGYLDGVTSAIQTQLNAKAGTAVATTSANGLMSSTDKIRVDDLYKRIAGYAVTAGTTSAYTATITGVTLTHGTMIALRFNATNAKNATLNVNSLGAKPIYYKGAAITASRAPANAVMLLVYDTTQVSTGAWHCIYSYDANSTYSNASLGQGYATCDTAAATVAKTAALSSYALSTGGIVAVKFTYDVPANATLNVNSKGAKAIYYKGAAITGKVIKAGDVATFIYNGTQYHLIAIDSSVAALTSDPREAEGETPELSAVPINADQLGGIDASEYATKEWVLNNIRFASEVNW